MKNAVDNGLSNLIDRYHRQIVLKEIGLNGQIKLSKSRVVVVGCGANGSSISELLIRAGVGFVRLIDRDFVEEKDLHRVRLFNEKDSRNNAPKAIALAEKLREINSSATVEAIVDNVSGDNILGYVKDVDLIVDGSDNLELRFLINEASVETGVPWVMMGVERWFGMVKFIRPNHTACLRCFMKEPSSRSINVCEIYGVASVAPALTTSIGAVLALKYLVGLDVEDDLIMINGYRLSIDKIRVNRLSDCHVCVKREYRYLGRQSGSVNVYCGVDAVEIRPSRELNVDLDRVFNKLHGMNVKKIADNILLLRIDGLKVMLYSSGKMVIYGTVDVELANKIYGDILAKLTE